MDSNIVPDDVVISGIGGAFPQSENLVEFRKRLYENKSLLELRYENNELGVCPFVGVIDSNHFDNTYFGVHRKQCFHMDPMHWRALECTFSALLDAGVNPHELSDKRVGVFFGSTIGENDVLFTNLIEKGYGLTGSARALMPNRISYWLNLKGPSLNFDCNWTSGMEVLRLANIAIKTGQCDSVIIGTTNITRFIEVQWLYEDMGLLSNDGSTRAFDENAIGYGRSDGVVVMYVQRSSEARRSYASIMHIATRFDGNHDGNILNMEEKCLTEFLEEFYQKCPIKPEDIDYVETYGCGIKSIDELELNSIEKILGKSRKKPLQVTSVKTVTGNSEATASLFSIVSVLLAMEEEVIPATIQYEKPNPNIPGLLNGNLEVVTQNKKWTSDYAAVNALGINSYFGHAVFKKNPKKKVLKQFEMPPLLLLSTRTEEGLNAMFETVKSKPKDPEYYKLIQEVFSRPIKKHLNRGYLLFGEEGHKQETSQIEGIERPIWFVYSGMGSQWCGMLGDFMKIEVFANSIKKSHDILAAKGLDLIHIITTTDTTIFDTILNCFVGIAAIQIALTDVLKTLGIVPDGIIGHSVGELGCAYADGCMTAEQMILSSYYRGIASLEATLIKGMMAAIGLGYEQMKNRLPPTVEVACRNSSESCTISGPVEEVEKVVKQLQTEGIFARLVNVAGIAYHSQYIKPAAPLLLKYLKTVLDKPVARSSKWISTSNQESNWNTHLAKHSSAEYHTNNLLSSVLFEDGCKHVPEDAILIEIAPHGLLQAILKRSFKSVTNVPLTLRKSPSSVEFLLDSLGKLYLAGLDMNLSKIYPNIEYPVSRNTPSLGDLVHWVHSEAFEGHNIVTKKKVQDIMVTIRSEQFRECVGHQLDEKFILPTSYYLDILLQFTKNFEWNTTEMVYENLHFRKPLVIPKTEFVPISGFVQEGSGEFEVYSNEDLLLTGRMVVPLEGDELELNKAEVELDPENVQLTESDFYQEMQHRGYKYSGAFKLLKDITLGEEGSVSNVEWKNDWKFLLEAMIQQQLFHTGERNQEVEVPRFIQRVVLSLPYLSDQRTESEVTYEYATSIISTNGIEISGMTTVPLDPEDHMHFGGVECIPLNGTYKNFEAGIDFAIQLIETDYIGQDNKTVFLTELRTENSLSRAIKDVLNTLPFTVNYTSVEEVSSITVHPTHPQLFVVNGPVSNDILGLALSSGASLLTKSNEALLSHSQLIPVAQFRVGVDDYVILRKISRDNSRIITVKGDSLSTKDLQRPSLSWVAELHAAIDEESSRTENKVCLVSNLIPAEGFYNFVLALKSLPNTTNLKVVFNLDKKPIDLNLIMQRDLTLTILKGGAWHAYLPYSTQYRDDIELVNVPISGGVENHTINYISVNLRDETINPATQKRSEVGNIDYSSVTKKGDRVMGLARLDDDTSKLVLDPLFSWPIPEDWLLTDGATVPHAYVSAYYMLMIVAKLKPGNTVLIHAGCSPIGLAACSIANQHGCFVYVTVSTSVQRAFLVKHFHFLKDSNILNSDDESFRTKLLQSTSGKGAEVILNCVSGTLLQYSLDCIADYGRFIQYGKYDPAEGNTIGMFCFLRNPSFYVVDLNDLFFEPKDVKEELWRLMSEGLKKLVVRPLVKEVVNRNDIDNTLRKLESSANIGKIILKVNDNIGVNKLNVKKSNKYFCNEKQSYLVCGGSAEIWTDLVEWLVRHGAKRIVVSVDAKPTQNYNNRRLSLLQTYFDVQIIVASSKAHTKEGATALLSEVSNLGPINLVFTLPNETTCTSSSDVKSLQNLDSALRSKAPKAVLVNFVNVAAGFCYARAEAGFLTYNIQWPDTSDIADGISILDGVLNSKVSNVVAQKRQTDHGDDSGRGAIKDLIYVIPSTEELIKEQKNAKQEPEWTQVTSEGPISTRDLPPVFIVRGMTGQKELDKMIQRLLLPTFVTVPPVKSWLITKMAEVYAKKMRAIYPKGVYNIVSTSSGGALAIEIIRILQQEKASLHLFFVDSAPDRIQQALKKLGEDRNQQGLNLLKQVFDIKDSEVLRKLRSINDWENRIKICLDSYDFTKRERSLLEAGLLRLQGQIDNICAYGPSDGLVSGRVHLIVPNVASLLDNCGLELYCQATPTVTLVPGDHLSIISHNNTTDYINTNHWIV